MRHLLLPALFVISAACQQPVPAKQEAKKDSLPLQAAASTVQTVLTELDTISIGGRLYNIVEASQQEFDEVPGTPADTSEARALSQAQGRVRRSGDSLIFQLDNGQRKILVNNFTDGDDFAEFHYQGYIPGLQHWIIFHAGYEWFCYDLVNKATGEVESTIGVPQLSPDGKQFICSNSDLIAGFTENGFELYEYRHGKVRKVQTRMLEKWGPVGIKWKSPDQLFAHMLIVSQDMEETSRYVRLTPR